eukprot:8715613-Karenia_brevis.AAC.1
MPSPPPGAPGRKEWKQQGEQGPVSLLLQQLHYFAMALDHNTYAICTKNHPPVSMFDGPYQMLTPQVQERAIRARNTYAISHRTVLK